MLQVQSTFSKQLPQRCRDLEDIIRTTSTKELRHALPYLVENMFGFGPEAGWGLEKISKHHNIHDFEAVRRFLSPDSPLLSLIYKLQADLYLSYEFSFKHLPAPTRQMIEDGMVPVFFVNKLQTQGFGQMFLSLGAFEYFMFHFAYALVNPSNQQVCPAWNNLYDFLYPNLVDDYLSYFLPLDKKVLPPMPTMPSPVRSPVSHYSGPSTYSGHSPVSPNTTPPRHRTRPSLFKTTFTAVQKQHVQGSPVLDQSEAETWRSETMLQVFAEFWLNQNPGEADRSSLSHSSFHTHITYYRKYASGFDRDPFAYLFENYMPSLNQVKIVRLLVKYLHFFSNSAHSVVTSQYQTTIQTPLDEFKRTAVSRIIQKKLYTFLRHAFDRWPLDSSFRMVLETWLSYIQPWRYTDPHQYYLTKDPHRPDPTEVRDRRVDDKWEQFIEENLLFYTVLFQEFLPRVFRLDLASPQSAYMLYRVTRVFSLPNLSGLVFKAESWSYRSSRMHMTPDLGSSYLSAEHLSNLLPSLPPHLADLEGPGFQYVLMFGQTMNARIHDLINQLLTARETVINQQMTAKPKSRGFAAWLASIFTDSYAFGDSMSEMRKLQLHLNQSLRNLSDIFKINLPEELQDMTLPQDMSAQTSMLAEPTMPDSVETSHGPVLTPLGRYQVVNGLRKFDTLYHGDPDLQPIRSFENATLVRVLHQFCVFVNSQFAAKINQLYYRPGLMGRMAQVCLAPPLSPNQQLRSPVAKPTAEAMRQPRFSLRFLASYQTLMYIGILYIFLRLWWGIGPVEYVLLLLFMCLLYAFFRALVRPKATVET